ncbi:MAG TPA: hypothetical protein VIO81_02220 [Methyloversatilis sp.]
MKTLLSLIFCTLLMAACATKPTPAGVWDYSVEGTPEGDVKGVMTIAPKDGKSFAAVMQSNGSELAMDKFVYDEDTKKMLGEFTFSGMLVKFDAVQADEEINGAMWVSGLDFPFKATRKK